MKTATYDYTAKNSSIEAHPSWLLRRFAYFFSILFHPLLISSYTVAFLIYVHPAVFEGVDPRTANLRMLSVLLFSVFFPGFELVSGLAAEISQKPFPGSP